MTSFLGTGGLRGRKGIRLARFYPRSFNMALRKEVIERVGGFDKGLYPGEDPELSLQIREAGYRLVYTGDVFLLHRRRSTLLGFIKQVFVRGRSRLEIGQRHKELLEPLYLLPTLMVLLVPFFIILSLSFPFILRVLSGAILAYLFLLLSSGIHASLKVREIRALPVVPLLLLLQHITYGIGFLWALLIRGR